MDKPAQPKRESQTSAVNDTLPTRVVAGMVATPDQAVGQFDSASLTHTCDVSPTDSCTPAALSPGTTVDQYQLIRELGRGGMGAVHLARDTRLGRRVAIKFLAHDNSRLAERFLIEARVTARCKHDNIVDIYDVGETPSHSYMVLEYLPGQTLRAWMRERWQPDMSDAGTTDPTGLNAPGTAPGGQRAPVSPTLAVELMVPVVRALVHAHERGLVHRDLKPGNIMLADDGAIKVLDFGIAKLLEQAVEESAVHSYDRISPMWSERDFETADGALIGTMPYMSPEQWGAGDIDERTDIWAVGIILFELCTGRHPLAPLTRAGLQAVGDLQRPMPSLDADRPRLGPLADIVEGCLCKRATERIATAQALLDRLKPLLPVHQASTHGVASDEVPVNPYVGLAAFQPIDASRFFGRERDVASLVTQLRNHRLVTVAGPSGAGKSSLVRAGLIPALERSGQVWEAFIVRPGRQPLAALAQVLAQVARPGSGAAAATESEAVHARIDDLRSHPGVLGTVLRDRCQQRHSRAVLFVDQFEELYTLGADRDAREAFVQCLEGVADDASSPLRVILSVRSDFLDRVAEDRAFTSEIIRGLTLLAPLGRAQLRAALIEPLTAAGLSFESEALIATMLDSLEATRAPLPLLQFTAARLWDARDPGEQLITQDSYDALGGIEGALASHADTVLAGLAGHERKLARTVCTSLVSDERTRAIVSVDELRANVGAEYTDDLERVMRNLAQARLVHMESDEQGGATVELAHESLIERWPKLVHWLDEDQDAAQFRARLRAAARQWDKQGRTDDLLWRGQAADQAGHWQERADALLGGLDELGGRDQAYLQAVVALAARARRRRRRVVAATVAFLSLVAVVVSLLAVRAERKADEAERQARRADDKAALADVKTAEAENSAAEARDSAAEARNSAVEAENSAAEARNATRMASATLHRTDPALALALVREIEPSTQQPPHWRELARWATHQNIAQVILSHQDAIFAAGFSPDGTRIVTSSYDRTARIWNADGTGLPIVLLQGHQRPGLLCGIQSRRWSHCHRFLWIGHRTCMEPRLAPSTPMCPLKGHQCWCAMRRAFSPDGTRVVTASVDHTIARLERRWHRFA